MDIPQGVEDIFKMLDAATEDGSDTAREIEAMTDRFISLIDGSDTEAVFALLTDDVVVDDPVGLVHLEGRNEVETFMREGRKTSNTSMTRTGPILVTAGNEAAFSAVFEVTNNGARVAFDTITTLKFDDEFLIREFRGFWHPARKRPVP